MKGVLQMGLATAPERFPPFTLLVLSLHTSTRSSPDPTYHLPRLTYLFGAAVYGLRLPESAFPKRFDYIGSSHQLWHACVVLAAYQHFTVVLQLWRSMSEGPPLGQAVAQAMAQAITLPADLELPTTLG